ncbi:MAG: hypothetical protein R2867_19520 [Caldilineaceae bacterium]
MSVPLVSRFGARLSVDLGTVASVAGTVADDISCLRLREAVPLPTLLVGVAVLSAVRHQLVWRLCADCFTTGWALALP